ncbi:hypothetical protein Trydic_g20027 [Trypoxylus dichotomus]
MSRATKRKHVLLEVLQDDFSPPTANQQIVKILRSRGNNLHEVLTPDNIKFLASMPTKFRKNVWVKRGDYVLVEPITEGDKVKAEMVKMLTREHIKCYKREGVWPSAFDVSDKSKDAESDDHLFVNTNRRQFSDESDDDDSDSKSSDTD